MNEKPHDPLPKELLPKSGGGEPALWENRVQNLMTAASPLLAQYRAAPMPWWSVLAERFQLRLALAAAAAAAVMLTVHFAVPGPGVRSEPSLSLAAVIGDGNTATALLSAANEQIDPVLALVIFEGEMP